MWVDGMTDRRAIRPLSKGEFMMSMDLMDRDGPTRTDTDEHGLNGQEWT